LLVAVKMIANARRTQEPTSWMALSTSASTTA
jgi:hypothetical protein